VLFTIQHNKVLSPESIVDSEQSRAARLHLRSHSRLDEELFALKRPQEVQYANAFTVLSRDSRCPEGCAHLTRCVDLSSSQRLPSSKFQLPSSSLQSYCTSSPPVSPDGFAPSLCTPLHSSTLASLALQSQILRWLLCLVVLLDVAASIHVSTLFRSLLQRVLRIRALATLNIRMLPLLQQVKITFDIKSDRIGVRIGAVFPINAFSPLPALSFFFFGFLFSLSLSLSLSLALFLALCLFFLFFCCVIYALLLLRFVRRRCE
jgi:hypothetical protein